MINILTPPSPLATHSSLPVSGDRLGSSERLSRTYGLPESSSSRGGFNSFANWLEDANKAALGQPQIPIPYHTPPHTDVYRTPIGMLQQESNGPVMAGQPFSVPRAAPQSHTQNQQTSSQPPVHIPQLPVPQPHVTYQPVSTAPTASQPNHTDKESNDDAPIASYMQIPASINGSRGSLSEFAAQITCLFWFESISTLQRVEDAKSTPEPQAPLAADAKPSLGFRKWVTTMLSTTQVTQNVILLALMFIYRLKTQNPQVRGKSGSEYRLLTVALMLGNKFLDDNTYTNKTWADVSGISVSEIHVMEVEFLSNMRYNLFTSEEDWTTWHKKLGRFYDYFAKASKSPQLEYRKSPPQPHSPPNTLPNPMAANLRMPPIPQRSSPPYLQNNLHATRGNQFPQLPEPIMRSSEVETVSRTRKRSLDESTNEQLAKRPRPSVSTPNGIGPSTPGLSTSASTPYGSEIQTPRLPLPNFAQHPSNQTSSNTLFHPTHLPPPPSNRAMAMVYGQPMHNNSPSQGSTSQASSTNGSRVSMPLIPPVYDAPTQNGSSKPYAATSGSPSNLTLTPTSHELLSPSGFPMHRLSPYRPVRRVNTLLVPPPSGSLQAPAQDIGSSNIYYQPLGKPMSERRSGIVPYLPPANDRSPWLAPYSQYSHAH